MVQKHYADITSRNADNVTLIFVLLLSFLTSLSFLTGKTIAKAQTSLDFAARENESVVGKLRLPFWPKSTNNALTHQVLCQAINWDESLGNIFCIFLIRIDDLHDTFGVVMRIQNFIQPGVTLFIVEEIYEGLSVDGVRLVVVGVLSSEIFR